MSVALGLSAALGLIGRYYSIFQMQHPWTTTDLRTGRRLASQNVRKCVMHKAVDFDIIACVEER